MGRVCVCVQNGIEKIFQRDFQEELIHQKDSLQSKLSDGLQQTAAYMQRFHAPEGHLLLFDRRAGKSWDERIWVKKEQATDGQPITVWGL